MEEYKKNNRNFKGVWIPKEIWLNTDLTIQEKVFLVEIDSLDNDEGCTASNQYFSDFFGISKKRVSLVIQQLISKGYIKSTFIYKENSKQILYRVLNIYRPPYPTFMREGIPQKEDRGIPQKFQDNNIYNNNINNNIDNIKEIYKENFLKFYELYPKKQGKANVEKWFMKNKPSEELFDTIIKQLKIHIRNWQKSKTELQYIPMPSTWLNQKRWEDEIAINTITTNNAGTFADFSEEVIDNEEN